MYLEACLQQRQHFSTLVASVDGLLEVEAKAALERIASRLETKCQQLYSKMCRYVNSRIDITMVLATNRCIRGSRVPAQWISVQPCSGRAAWD